MATNLNGFMLAVTLARAPCDLTQQLPIGSSPVSSQPLPTGRSVHVPPAATPDLGKKGKENRASPCAPSALPRVSWVDRRSGWLLAPPCPAPGSARRGGTPLAPPPQLRAPLRLRAAPQLPLAPYTVAAAPTTPSRPLTPHAAAAALHIAGERV